MSVSSKHPEYDKHVETWERVRAACAGSRAVKAGRSKYLPKPTSESSNDSLQTRNDHRYRQYIERALYSNFCGRTLAGLKGAAFRKDPEITLPAGLEYLEQNATGAGTGLVQLAKDEVTELLSIGRDGFLVDYPAVEAGATAEQTAGIEARILAYTAESVVNWRTANVNGRVQLSLVVLRECVNISDDEFEYVEKEQFRVLRLRDNIYTQQIYQDDVAVSDEIIIRMASGSTFDFIPFCFAGATNNDFTVDQAPMEGMAEVNVGHYRNSADVEENSFIHGQLTLGVSSSLSTEEWKEANPDGIVVGSRAGHFLGENGDFHSVQAEASSLTRDLMADKRDELVMLGAQLITDKNGNQTAKAAQIQHSSEHSVLGDVVGNLSETLKKCIEWCGLFMGVTGDVEFIINTEFFEDGADAQMIIASIQLYDREVIGMTDLRGFARKAGITDRSDEDIDADEPDINQGELPEEPKRMEFNRELGIVR